MSGDKLLGQVCCLPRRQFCMLLALAHCCYGWFQVFAWLIFHYLHHAEMSRGHCQGDDCFEIATCHGMQDTTYHIRETVLVAGGAICGLYGLMGGINGYGSQVIVFAMFLAVFAATLVGSVVFDGLYMLVCDCYATNTVYLGLLWPFPPNLPIDKMAKRDVMLLDRYKIWEVSQLVHVRPFSVYLCVSFGFAAFYLYACMGSLLLARYLEEGVAGLGPNFSLKHWKEALTVKQKAKEIWGQTQEAAVESFNDVTGGHDGYGALEKPPRWRPPPMRPEWNTAASLPEGRESILLP